MSIARLMQQASAGVSAGGVAVGLSDSLDTWSGQGAATGSPTYSETRSVDISAYSGKEVRIVLHYVNGTTANSYRGDIMIDTIAIPSLVTYSFDSEENWETVSDTQADDYSLLGSSFIYSLTTNTEKKWSYINGNSGSSGTGVDLGTSMYVETSGSSSQMAGANFWARSPSITLPSSPTLSYKAGRYGDNVGTFNFHLEVIS